MHLNKRMYLPNTFATMSIWHKVIFKQRPISFNSEFFLLLDWLPF